MKTFKKLISCLLVFSMIASMLLTVTAATSTERTGISIDRVTTQNKLGENATYPEGYYVTDKRLDKAPVTFEFWAYVPESVWSTASGVVLSTYAEIGASTNTNDWFTLSIEPSGSPKLSIGYSDGRLYEKTFDNSIGKDTWTHVSIVLNDETNRVLLYINGVYTAEADFGAGDSAPILNQNLDTLLYLLSDAHVANGKAMCDIKISDVAVYSDMRTAAEVSSDYVNGVNANADNLMLYYQISEDDKEKDIKDESGNGYDMKYNRTFITEAEMDAIRAQEDKDYAYSIVLLPDTHFYTTTATQKRKAILDYVIAKKASKNIQYVIGLGDMSGDGKAGEWELVKEEYGRLDAAGIPYSVIRGNHDSVSNPAAFNAIFGQGTAYYEHVSKNGGFYKTNSSTNTYVCFKANNDVDYMILNLDFGIDRDVLNWADKVLSEHPNHRVIVSTHAWLSGDGRMLVEGSSGEPSMYNPAYLDPDYIWDKCLSRHANIDMIVCGHTQSDQILTTPIVGVNGNVVYQVLINNQNSPWQLSGLGNIAIMNFTADGRFANIAYYATVHGKYFYEGNADIKFDFDAKDAVPERTGVEFEEVKTSGVSHPDGYYKSEDKLGDLPATYEAWVNVKDSDAFKTGGSILGNREKGKNSYFALELLPWGQISLKYVNEGTQKTYTFPVEPDSSRPTVNPVRIWNDGWHHLAVTHDVANNKIKCYIDGVFASEMSADGFALPAFSNMSSTLYLGSDGEDGHSKFGASGSFAGVISDAALYCDVRTDAEIKSDFENGVSAGDADLLAAYDISSFNQNRDIEDISGNGVDIKKYNSNIVMDGTKESYSTVKGLDAIPQTYEMWIYLPAVLLSDLKSDVIFGNCNAANNNGIRIDIKENAFGEIRLSYLGDWAQAVSWGAGATISADTWTHVAITHDIATREVKFYFNGVLGATRDLGFTPDPAKVLANTTFYLGADGHDRSSLTEPRVLGDFAAYSDVRSADEIAASYKNGIDVNDANLMLYWDIPETGKGQDIKDKSNNNVDLDYNSLLVLDRSKESYSTSKGFDVVPQTYEMWAYLPAESNQALNNIIFSNVSMQNPNGIRIDFQEGKNGFVRLAYLNDWIGATAWETGATVPVNTWVHVTIVHDLTAKNVYFYFNGELKATRENVAAPDAAKVLANTEFYFGGDARDPAHSAPTRVLGDFAVYSDVRTAAEVMNDYKNGPDVNDSNIMLYWDVPETNEKQDIEDKTGNGYDLKYSLVDTAEIKIDATPEAGGTVSGAGIYDYGSSVTVTATANQGYNFLGWYVGNEKVSNDAVYSFTALETLSLTAKFRDPSYIPTSYENCMDYKGNLLNPHFVNGIIWDEENGAIKVPAGSAFNFLLFDDTLETNRVEATFVISDNTNSDKDHRNGIVFGFTDIDGDLTTTSNWDTDISYYWAFVNDWGCLQLWEMGAYDAWGAGFTGGPSVDLKATYGIDVTKGVTLAAEWDDEGHIKVYANDNLVFDVVDSTPITGDYYGILQFQWSSANTLDATYVTSFVAGGKLETSNVDATVDPTEAGTVEGAGEYTFGASVTLTATANKGYKFIGWYENGSLVCETAEYTFTAKADRELTAKFEKITYSVAVDGEGNRLNPHFVNGIIWDEENGAIKVPAGSAFNFLLFDDTLKTNRVEATFVIGDNTNSDQDHRNGIVFGFTDIDGDLTTTSNWDTDISYYWAFVNDWGHLQLWEMGAYDAWGAGFTGGPSVDLKATYGIDVTKGVTLAAEWDDEGHVKVYANGNLVFDVVDSTPITGDYYGILQFQWSSANTLDATYVTSFVAGDELVWAEPIFTVDMVATEGGSVTGSGEYDLGESVTITATPDAGYRFLGWSENGELVSIDAVFTFTAKKNCTLTANFVAESLFGDANGDGRINIKDVVLLRKYIANFDFDTNTSSVDVEAGADANGDGLINMEDVVFIRKYIINYDYDAEKEDTPKKYVAFTFDDGPSGDVTLTQKYVYEFAKYGGKATLFLVGNAIAPSTSSGFVYAAENGWDIGIHGYSHVGYGTGCSDSDYAAEVNKTADAIHQYLPDYEINLLRPPYGDITADRVASSQYSTILWSISSEDWAYYGGATEAERNEKVQIIVDNVINGIKDGDIILMHEPNANTLTAMRVLLEMLHEQGYEFVTVSELLGDNREAGKIYYSGK